MSAARRCSASPAERPTGRSTSTSPTTSRSPSPARTRAWSSSWSPSCPDRRWQRGHRELETERRRLGISRPGGYPARAASSSRGPHFVKRISILLVVLTALFVTACASEEGASDAISEPPPTVEPTPEPTEEPEPSGSSFALPSLGFDGDPELASRFPDTVGGIALEVQSISGDAFASLGGSDPTFQTFLDSIGAELSDVSVAFGGAADPSDPTSVLSVGAF